MNRDSLLTLYTYNAYANQLLFDTVGLLNRTELTHEFSPSHGSIRALLIHMLAVEATYLSFCQGRPVEEPSLLTLADIRRYWSDLEREQQTYIASLGRRDLNREIPIQIGEYSFRFPVWQMLIQAFLHSNHHRGELSILLSILGHPLPTMDIIVYLAKQSGQEWPWK